MASFLRFILGAGCVLFVAAGCRSTAQSVYRTAEHSPMTEPSAHGYERLTGDSGSRHVLDLDVPLITLPVMPGRNLAVLTEAATRLHILRTKGIDPAAMFIARHSNLLERSTP